METLRATYRDDDDEDDEWSNINNNDPINETQPTTTTTFVTGATTSTAGATAPPTENNPQVDIKEEQDISDELSEDELSDDDNDEEDPQTEPQQPPQEPKPTSISDDDDNLPVKKQKPLSSFTSQPPNSISPEPTPPETTPLPTTAATATKKPGKKKNNNVWTTKSSRKWKKKSKPNSNHAPPEDTVLITPVPRFPDKTDDSPDMHICLSKVYKAEKVELSDDRLSAGSSKGYRMVRTTRGVVEGAWYFEIKVAHLGETGHTRLGWSTEKGDLQAPVGYDGNSFGFRDVDGCKIHKALREKYAAEGYVEGDVIGCYINLPEGELYAPKPPHLVWYKGQRYAYAADGKEDPPKVVPGSEISFFKNGVCQGVAFKDLYGGRYYPAASMYTLPNQPNCVVKFNFGPDFEVFPQEFEGRSIPRPMIEVPYHGFDGIVKNGVSDEKKN